MENNELSQNERSQVELSPKQREAITALVVQPTVRAAASAVGVTPVTIWRWLRNEHFRAAYDEARRLVAAHTAAALQVAGQQALANLLDVMNNEQSADGARVRAAQIILDRGIEMAKLAELEGRIREVEAASAEEY